jgi:hypothetical protein
VVDNGLPTTGKRLVFIDEERSVLLSEKKAGSNGIYSKAFTEFLCEFNGQPSGKILYRCLGRTLPRRVLNRLPVRCLRRRSRR